MAIKQFCPYEVSFMCLDKKYLSGGIKYLACGEWFLTNKLFFCVCQEGKINELTNYHCERLKF